MLKNILLGVICLLCMATISGCQKGCANVCLRGSICLGGTCSCPDPYSGSNCDTLCLLGYEGYLCQTPSRDKFLNGWLCTSADQSATTQTYLISFIPDTNQLHMLMYNFNNIGGYPINCTMTGKYSFDISEPLQGTTGPFVGISGSGKLNNGKITIYILSPTNTYFATAVKQ